MTIRQTRSGTLPENIEYTGTCRNCGAKYVCQACDLGKRNKIDCQTIGCNNKVGMYCDSRDNRADNRWPKARERKAIYATHHLDRDPTNNDLSNLITVPINPPHPKSFL